MTTVESVGDEIIVAIAGNPNTGKTTILNALVGSNFTVGNWPGVTVEKKEGEKRFEGVRIRFVDLPGIYTLEPVSDDERVARDYLTNERPHVILNVVETPNLQRNLDFMESELGKSAWFAGNVFSAADIQMSFPLEAASARGGLNESRPKLWAFLQNIHARPAYLRALEKGGKYELLR